MRVDKNIISAAALLHDVGKLMRRSGEEKSHQENSFQFIKDMLKASSLFFDEEIEYIAELALYHHYEKSKSVKLINGSNNAHLRIIIDSDSDSAAERKTYTGEQKGSIERRPLSSIISAVNSAFFDDMPIEELLVYYPAECNKGHLEKDDGTGKTKNAAGKMLAGFKAEFLEILAKSQTKEDFINSLHFLIKKYMTYVTSSGKEKIRDISLYHHSFTTAAFAVNRFINSKAPDATDEYKGKDTGKYTLLLGRIFDSERYIFDNLNKNVEKPLKRVFTRINLLAVVNTIIPYQIARELGLFAFNVIYSAGDTFALVLPEALKEETVSKIEEIKYVVSEIFEHKIFLEYDLEDIFLDDKKEGYDVFRRQFFVAASKLNEKRYQRNLNNLMLDLNGEYRICQNCGINTSYGKYCRICSIENRWMDIDIKNFKIKYNYANIRNIEDPALLSEHEEGPDIFFDYDYCQNVEDMAAAVRHIGRYEITKSSEMCKLCRYRDNCDIKETEEGTVSLNCLAGTSPDDALLATAKIDLDDTEFLLYHVYPLEKFGERYPFSVSRLSYLSEQIDLFFSSYIPKIIEEKYENKIMVLLGSGDEAILTGVWEDVLKAIVEIEKAFENYVAGANKAKRKLSLSSAVVFHRSYVPFNFILSGIERNMHIVKESGNAVAINGQVITYTDLYSAIEISEKIKGFIENGWISRKFLFDMLSILSSSISGRWKGAIAAAKRAALFNYIVERNVMSEKDLPENVKNDMRNIFYDLMVESNNLSLSRFIIELAIRKTKGKDEDE